MKKVILGVVMAGVVVSFSLNIAQGAWWDKKGKKESTPVENKDKTAAASAQSDNASKAKPVVNKEDAASKKKQTIAQKQKDLDNTEWTTELSSSGSAKKQIIKIIFKNKKVSSTFLESDFPESNYTLSFTDDGVLIWETMQTGIKQGVAFWRGEVSSDLRSMRGIISHQLNNKTTDYNFVTTNREAVITQQ